MKSMKCVQVALLACLLGTLPALADGVDGQQAFDKLKTLAGSWQGTPEGEGPEPEAEADQMADVRHEIAVSANGTVVMETMAPGTPHEMINMYHLDGEDLVLTHYCAAGNQPIMRLDRAASSDGDLVFAFAGGTNLDPATDQHIHDARITWKDADHIDSVWSAHAGGKKVGVMTFHLERGE